MDNEKSKAMVEDKRVGLAEVCLARQCIYLDHRSRPEGWLKFFMDTAFLLTWFLWPKSYPTFQGFCSGAKRHTLRSVPRGNQGGLLKILEHVFLCLGAVFWLEWHWKVGFIFSNLDPPLHLDYME